MPGGLGGEKADAGLREAKTFTTRARAASFAAVLQGLFAAAVTLVGLGFAPTSLPAKLLLLTFAIVPTVLSIASRVRASRARKSASDARDRAWLAATEEIAGRGKRGATAAEVAKTLGVDEARADALLTKLAASDRTRIDVGDDAEIRYSVRGAELGDRVRVGDGAGEPGGTTDTDGALRDPLEEEFAALEEAEAKRGAGKRSALKKAE